MTGGIGGAYRREAVAAGVYPEGGWAAAAVGVAALEDKLLQRAVVEALNAIYEAGFLGFSYGFRPGRSQLQVLDALAVGILRKKVNWVLDADIRGFTRPSTTRGC
jgi:retron-type reverse transcriptase